MADSQPHCSLNFHTFGPIPFENFGHRVSSGIYGNAGTFTAPPYTQVVFDGLVTDVHDTYEAYFNGGLEQKGEYMTAYGLLLTALNDTATYVDGLPGLTEAMITLAGYTPTKTGVTSAVICAAPVIDKIDRETKGVLKPWCKPVAGADYIGCIVMDQPIGTSVSFVFGQIAIDGGSPVPPGPGFPTVRLIVTKGRKKVVPGLTSGKEYWVYFYAGNAAGVSDLSAGVSIICG
jgi:hypothetical protein